MNRSFRSIAVILAAVLVVAGAVRRVQALGPSALMFYGGTLKAPIVLSGAETNAFGDLLAPPKSAVGDTTARPYLKVAVYWGPASDPSLRGLKSLADLKPEMAWQHGKFFAPTATQPAVLLVTPLNQKQAQDLPDFQAAARFVWGGVLTPAAVAVLQKAGLVPAPKTSR